MRHKLHLDLHTKRLVLCSICNTEKEDSNVHFDDGTQLCDDCYTSKIKEVLNNAERIST